MFGKVTNKMKNLYLIGYRAERTARKSLEAEGYTVIRSAKSGGPFDLVAFNRAHFRLIQVKVVTGSSAAFMSNECVKLQNIPSPNNCMYEIWVWEKAKGWWRRTCEKGGEK